MSDVLTAVAARSFPRSRRADGLVVRDCAREAIEASGPRHVPRECLSLVAAGLRARGGVAARELSWAPWRSALRALVLPLAAAMLMLWTFGFVPRYDHWPLGEGWALLLGGSLAAVSGAALRLRWLAAIGAGATFVAAASPYLGLGTESALAGTPTFFQGYGVDLGAASLLPTLLLVAGALSLPPGSRRPVRVGLARLALGLAPAIVALLALLPAPTREPTYMQVFTPPSLEPKLVVGAPDPMPWIWPSRTLVVVFAVVLGVAVVVTWMRAHTHPAHALATGLVLASVAYPLVRVAIHNMPTPYWAFNGPHPWLLAILPLLLALTLARRAGRLQHR